MADTTKTAEQYGILCEWASVDASQFIRADKIRVWIETAAVLCLVTGVQTLNEMNLIEKKQYWQILAFLAKGEKNPNWKWKFAHLWHWEYCCHDWGSCCHDCKNQDAETREN